MEREKDLLKKVVNSQVMRDIALQDSAAIAKEREKTGLDPNKPIPEKTLQELLADSERARKEGKA
jgi:hypothetical protein